MKSTICTIAAYNYLHRAYILSKSYLSFHPDGKVYIFIVGKKTKIQLFDKRIEVLFIEDLYIHRFIQMSFYYDIVELCTAIKPFIFEYLLKEKKVSSFVYFDPDIKLFFNIKKIFNFLKEYNFILTPHIYSKIENDSLFPDEKLFLNVGIFNLGFIGLKKSKQVLDFLGWWKSKLETQAFIKTEDGLFTDQKWMDLLPVLQSKVMILKEPQYNLAFWNIHQCKSLTKKKYTYYINSKPLNFVHFSDHNNFYEDSRIKSRLENKKFIFLSEIYHDYLKEQNYENTLVSYQRYDYEMFDNGMIVTKELRQFYFQYLNRYHDYKRNPWSTSDKGTFYKWLYLPINSSSIIPNYLYMKYMYINNITYFRDMPINEKKILHDLIFLDIHTEIEKGCMKQVMRDMRCRYPIYSLYLVKVLPILIILKKKILLRLFS